MQSLLRHLDRDELFDLGIVVTGSHLDRHFGHTVDSVRKTGIEIIGEVGVELHPRSGLTMAIAAGIQISEIAMLFEAWEPDIVMVLGDRPEMLAGALAAALMGIFVVHVHGGERSGSIDESIRHAISKLAHFHFVATDSSGKRLERMGEDPSQIFVVGAPGLDDLISQAHFSKSDLLDELGLRSDARLGVAIYHPVTHELDKLGEQAIDLLRAMLDEGLEVVMFRPNSDAGGDEIDSAIACFKHNSHVTLVSHIGRSRYLSLLKHADIMVGNSSSGIIEAASFELPVVDVGSRQNFRERSDNVGWASPEYSSIRSTIHDMLGKSLDGCINAYGDGRAGTRIIELLSSLDLNHSILAKINAY